MKRLPSVIIRCSNGKTQLFITNAYAPGIPVPLPPSRPHSPPWETEPEELQLVTQLLQLKCNEVELASRILMAGSPGALVDRADDILIHYRPLLSAVDDVLDWLAPMTTRLLEAVPNDAMSPMEMLFAIWYHHLLALHLKWDMSVLEASTDWNQLDDVQDLIEFLWDSMGRNLDLKERLEEAVAEAGMIMNLPPDEPPIPPFSAIDAAVGLMVLKCKEATLESQISLLVWLRYPERLGSRVTAILGGERLVALKTIPYLKWIASSMSDIIAAEAGDALFPAQQLFLEWYHHLVRLRLKWDVSMLRSAIRRSACNAESAEQRIELLLSEIGRRQFAESRAGRVLDQIQNGPVPVPNAAQQLLSSSLAGHPHLLSISADLAASTPGTSGMGRASNDVFDAQTGGNFHNGRGSSSEDGPPPNNVVTIRQ
ncbi:hypothetical protein SeLEV6574_g05140 [Synchytrium endobioticum]|uniref:Uncharacterized protein n=1 Tax=Synchytrium endobioticum TaxID=286115 RepID=A0A507CVZ0_9FUNG|nr:hypothetical protein SeLEV6574_g05140 [Synchytrium endobioticum]